MLTCCFTPTKFYTLIRNPAVLATPLSAGEGAQVVQQYRRHPDWALLGFGPDSAELHDELWTLAKRADFVRRRIYDARTALSMRRQSVLEFATANVRDFKGFGFKRVWNPLDE